MGIYDRLWSLLEDACVELDIKAAELGIYGGGSQFNELSKLLHQRSLLKSELETQQSLVTVIKQMISYTTLSMGEIATSVLADLMKEAAAANTIVTTTVNKTHHQKNLSLPS